jgi:hypothetical protein
MKTIFTRLILLITICAISGLSNALTAQVLEEIPNPPNYTFSWFNGGEDESLFFSYFDNNFNNALYNYNGVDLSLIPIPPAEISFLFYSHSYAGMDYLVVFDIGFNAQLYEFDGVTAEPLAIPAGFTFGNYVATYNDLMYFTLFDANFTSSLYQYNGEAMAEVEGGPEDLVFNGFITSYDETLWVTFSDPNTFETFLYVYDGAAFNSIGGLPSDISFMYMAYENGTDVYLGVADQNFVTDLYKFDGSSFELIPTPDNLFFSFIPGENMDANEVYISYFDNITFENKLYAYNGTSLNEIPLPGGFDFPNIASIFNGFTYISMFDNINFSGALFKLESGVLGQVDIPNNGNYSYHADSLLGEDYHIVNDQNFNPSLYKLDEANNALVEVGGPAGLNFNNFNITINDKMLLNYVDANFFGTLFLFDGTEFTEIPNPAGKFYSFFMTEQNGKIYLRYDDFNTFLGTLYVLTPNSLPTSLDNSVTTDINIPYFFQPSDFSFSDTDSGDSLSAIMITEIEQVGYLLWDGAHVYVGDIIPVNEIENLIFTPLQDEMGNPYDAFRFRVGDGEAFSEQDYLMQINVQDPATSTQENTLNAFVQVSPVPAVNYLNIQLETDEHIDNLRLYVFSATGQMMLQDVYRSVGNSFSENIQVSDWPVGTYYVVGRSNIGQFAKPLLILLFQPNPGVYLYRVYL